MCFLRRMKYDSRIVHFTIRKPQSTRFVVVLSVLGLSNCGLVGDGHFTVSGDSHTYVHVLYQSPALQSMVEQAVREKQEYINGLRSEKDRLATFLFWRPGKPYPELAVEMGKEPGYEVPGQTRFEILFESDVVPYTKVVFDDGPFRGMIGWLSRAAFDDPRTRFP
jgi:hypothetical protein